MANRKVTVLNPAGYQEQLQSGDVAIFDDNDVVLGTDKITLDAGNGSITAAGQISAAGSLVANAASISTDIAAYNSLYLPSTAGAHGIYVGGTNSAANVVIKGSDGSAIFAGSITLPDAGYRNSRGVKLFNNGIIQAVGTSTSNVFMGFDVADGASGASTSSILGSGAATFAGNVESGVYGEQSLAETKGVRITSDGEILASSVGVASTAPRLRIKNSTQGTTTLITDGGSATFAGGITSGGDQVLETGSLNVYQAANSGSTPVFNGGWNTGAGRNITSSIFSNGSATFAGALEAESIDGGTY